MRSIYKTLKSTIFSKVADSLRLSQNVKNTFGGVLFLVKLQAEISLENIHLQGNE